MTVIVNRRRLLVFEKISIFDFLLFLYFVTLHADQLCIPFSGMTLRLNNLVALVLLGVLCFRLKKSLLNLEKKHLARLSFLFFSLLVSAILSPFPLRCFLFLGWFGFTLVCYFILPYLCVMVFDSKRILKLLFLSFLTVGMYALLQLLLPFVGIDDPFALQVFDTDFKRPNAFSYEPSFYALYMTPFVMMANLHYMLEPSQDFIIIKRLKMSHLAFINGLYLISTAATTIFAYLIFFAFVFLISFKSSYGYLRKSLLKVGACLGLFLGVFSLLMPKMTEELLLKFFFRGFSSHHSFYERWVGIQNGWKLFLNHPFFGVGFGGIPPALFDSWLDHDETYKFLCPERVLPFVTNPYKVFEPSNVLMEVLGSLGVFGLLAFGYLLWIYFKKMFHAGGENKWAFIFLVSMAVTLIVLQFNQGLMRTYIWVMFALTYAIVTKQERDLTI